MYVEIPVAVIAGVGKFYFTKKINRQKSSMPNLSHLPMIIVDSDYFPC